MITQIIINSIIAGGIYAVIASGFTLLYGTMNFFNMAYGANFLVGAYSFYLLYRICAFPLIISAILACLFTALLMVLIDRLCYYGFRQKHVPQWTTVVISMSVAILLQAIVTIIFGSNIHMVANGIPAHYAIFGADITPVQIAIIVSVVFIMVIVNTYLKKSKTGKLIRAIANDKTMAKVVGINVERAYIAIIEIVSIMATIAGILVSLDSVVSPIMGSTALLKAIVASIIGGVGNIRGAVFAGILLGFIENFATLFVGSGWADAISLVLIIVLLLARPAAFGITETE